MRPTTSSRLVPTSTALIAALLAGCSAPPRYAETIDVITPPPGGPLPDQITDVRRLPMFTGDDGSWVAWDDLMDAVAWADVIIVGEQHDDAVGHAVQAAIAEDTIRRWPGAAVSLEMLERDEQQLVSDYFDGIIDADDLKTLTHSDGWGGDDWDEWYLPIIDAAKENGGRVVAANAPRRYVRLARTGGYERLAALPRDRRRYFEIPSRLPDGAYRERFFAVMMEVHAPTDEDEDDADAVASDVEDSTDAGSPELAAEKEPTTEAPSDPEHDRADEQPQPAHDDARNDVPATGDMEDEGEAQEPPGENETMPAMRRNPPPMAAIEASLRSQFLWDTTMAKSIADARRRGAPKVVHMVGQFHSDFDGGTVQQVRRFRPYDRILVISMQRAWESELREEDRGRADIVIYTGERPPSDEDAEAEDGTEGESTDGDAEQPSQPADGDTPPAHDPPRHPATTHPPVSEDEPDG
jgi:uncharacterized iron-regulated protein